MTLPESASTTAAAMTAAPITLLRPDWPAPAGVVAVVSTRLGGVSAAPYTGANLGDHVGDRPASVSANRRQLAQQTGQVDWPWLRQVHGTCVLDLDADRHPPLEADGAFSRQPGRLCAVLTADCQPVLLCDRQATQVAAIHAGWRGLASGVLVQALQRFSASPADLLAYLGPAIGPAHFEVGADVVAAFASGFGGDRGWQGCFVPTGTSDKYLADLPGLARWQLHALGVQQVFGGDLCTYSDPQRFYSHRRDGITGRFVSAIGLGDALPALA